MTDVSISSQSIISCISPAFLDTGRAPTAVVRSVDLAFVTTHGAEIRPCSLSLSITQETLPIRMPLRRNFMRAPDAKGCIVAVDVLYEGRVSALFASAVGLNDCAGDPGCDVLVVVLVVAVDPKLAKFLFDFDNLRIFKAALITAIFDLFEKLRDEAAPALRSGT